MSEEVELPCLVEQFKALWDKEHIKEHLDAQQVSDLQEFVDDGWDEDAWEFDWHEALKYWWWEPLFDRSWFEKWFETGALWDLDGLPIMLMWQPTHRYDTCWLVDGKLVSTFDILEVVVSDWAVDG